MANIVDLSSYWMPILRDFREFKEIAKAEEPELRYLLEAIDRTLNNMFIETSDEYGISRFEAILGIIPEEGATLSSRRFTILSKWMNKDVYTDSILVEILNSLCGEGNFEINENYTEYMLEIVTHLQAYGALDTVAALLKDIIPANLIVELRNSIGESGTSNIYAGGTVTTSMVYSIPYDPMTETVTVKAELNSVIANSVGVVKVIVD